MQFDIDPKTFQAMRAENKPFIIKEVLTDF